MPSLGRRRCSTRGGNSREVRPNRGNVLGVVPFASNCLKSSLSICSSFRLRPARLGATRRARFCAARTSLPPISSGASSESSADSSILGSEAGVAGACDWRFFPVGSFARLLVSWSSSSAASSSGSGAFLLMALAFAFAFAGLGVSECDGDMVVASDGRADWTLCARVVRIGRGSAANLYSMVPVVL
jgi:hypothetical protein